MGNGDDDSDIKSSVRNYAPLLVRQLCQFSLSPRYSVTTVAQDRCYIVDANESSSHKSHKKQTHATSIA